MNSSEYTVTSRTNTMVVHSDEYASKSNNDAVFGPGTSRI
jgi:hypothetical protein